MNQSFLAGFAAASAELVRLHDEPTMVADVLAGAGFTLQNFVEAKIDEYDLEVLRRLYEEERALRT